MPDILDLTVKWGKQILVAILLPTALVVVAVFLQPGKYLGLSTALPANSAAADRASVFSTNIRDLHSPLGSPDDIDKIIGTAQQDTVYLAVSDQFNLANHYKLKGSIETMRIKSANILKKNSKVTKSEFGELVVKAWDTERQLAPQLANAIMEKLAQMHQDILSESNKVIVKSLKLGQQKLQASIDSIKLLTTLADSMIPDTSKLSVLKDQVQEYAKLATEYQLMIDSNPAALVIVEKARLSERPDKPRRLLIISATLVLSIFFAFLLAAILDRTKH